jgi:uncharacterized membrane protein
MPSGSRHIAVAVDRPWQEVADYVGDPANLPAWAEGLGSGIEQRDGVWTAETPAGRVGIRFVEPNDLGVADHDVALPGGEVVHVPLRVLPLGDGAEVVLTIRRAPGMSDAAFDADEAAVRADLERLRRVLEARGGRG